MFQSTCKNGHQGFCIDIFNLCYNKKKINIYLKYKNSITILYFWYNTNNEQFNNIKQNKSYFILSDSLGKFCINVNIILQCSLTNIFCCSDFPFTIHKIIIFCIFPALIQTGRKVPSTRWQNDLTIFQGPN